MIFVLPRFQAMIFLCRAHKINDRFPGNLRLRKLLTVAERLPLITKSGIVARWLAGSIFSSRDCTHAGVPDGVHGLAGGIFSPENILERNWPRWARKVF